MNSQRIDILMAEDSPTDQAIVQEAIKHSKRSSRLHIVSNGEEVLSFLQRKGPFVNAPAPDLILLDINMPRKSGLEVLAEIKQDARWKHIPVIMLTGSAADRDVVAAYGYHANCYIVKPMHFEQLLKTIQIIESFWFDVVTMPPKK